MAADNTDKQVSEILITKSQYLRKLLKTMVHVHLMKSEAVITTL